MRSPVDGKTVRVITWDVKQNGAPIDTNLEKYVVGLGKSFEIGGVNAHISKSLGKIPYPNYARIVAQKGPRKGQVIAEWKPGPFLVW